MIFKKMSLQMLLKTGYEKSPNKKTMKVLAWFVFYPFSSHLWVLFENPIFEHWTHHYWLKAQVPEANG